MGDRHSRGWPAAEPGAAASRSHEPLRSTHRTARQYRKAANKKTIPPYQRGLPTQAAYPDTPTAAATDSQANPRTAERRGRPHRLTLTHHGYCARERRPLILASENYDDASHPGTGPGASRPAPGTAD